MQNIPKKVRAKIPKENKVRAELQKEVSSICPFCDSTDVGHFEIHHMDENPSNNENQNLMLLCPTCHSKITKGDISRDEVYKKKIELITKPVEAQKKLQSVISIKGKDNNAIVGNNNRVTIKQVKKNVKEKYPEGSIGHDTVRANYIGHLIKRYNEFKSIEVGKENVVYGMFNGHLKKKFKIGPTRTIYNLSIDKFEELVEYIHKRIDGTMFGKVKGGKHKNYSTFEEYSRQQTQKEIEPGIFLYGNGKHGIFCNSTVFFEGRICNTFPGVRGLREYNNPIDCVNRLELLLKNPIRFDFSSETAFTDPIWWERGIDGNIQIGNFKKLTNTKCLINSDEYEIKRIVVYHSQSRFKNFVYVEVNPEKPTGIYPEINEAYIKESIENGRLPREEYAVFEGRFLTRAEFDDGSAEIDGNVVEIYEKSELLVRCLSAFNFVIAAKASSFNCDFANENQISNYLNLILAKKIDLDVFAEMVEGLPRTLFPME